MKVAVIHHRLSSLGGGERVCLGIVEALNIRGIIPDLFIADNAQQKMIENGYGKKLKVVLKVMPLPKMKFFGAYRTVLYKLKIKVKEYDWVIDTSGIYIAPFNASKKYAFYVHNPIMFLRNSPKYQGGFWKIYFRLYDHLLRKSVSKTSDIQLIANSKFTQKRITNYWRRESIVIYPPVAINDFFRCGNKKSRDGVISIGRFTPEKNHLDQLKIAKQLPNLKFRICGAVDTPQSKVLFAQIKEKAKELDNVELHQNATFSEIVEMINHSKYFLHTMKDEDFGITICEAIAGGCLPVVHDSGGPMEIVPTKSLRFESVQEATSIIRNWEKNANWEDIQEYLFNHIKEYEEQEFQRNLLKIIGF